MIKEITVKAATEQEAIAIAAKELKVDEACLKAEVIEAAKKGLFKSKDAVIKVTAEVIEKTENAKLNCAISFLRGILDNMGLENVELDIEEKEDSAVITFTGDGVSALIGHHGETLDSLQYLTALACNRADGSFYRITLDCGNYREKREETLKALAARVANKAIRSGRSQILEPMNPYERRIIHSVVSDIKGVSSKSKGDEPNRRVVIVSDNAKPYSGNNRRKQGDRKPYQPHKPELTMEEILKADKNKEKRDDGADVELYSKLEF